MTIKKPISLKHPSKAEPAESAVAENPAPTGGATIADRFKLDVPESAPKTATTGKGTVIAVAAAVLGLAIAGILTYILWQHWSFLMPA